MTLFNIASELQLRLDVADTADEEDALLSRGRTVLADITASAEHLEAVLSYRDTMGRTDAPRFDTRAIRQAIGHLRGALHKSGPKALQQQSVATLRDVVSEQSKRVDRWVMSTWRENFSGAGPLLERASSASLHGRTTDRARARSRAATIETVRGLDPIRDRSRLEGHLKVRGLSACIERVNGLIEELRAAIAEIDRDQAAMTPEVREAIQRATSADGLPLGEVTPQLMVALRSAGVVDDLVVRRL